MKKLLTVLAIAIPSLGWGQFNVSPSGGAAITIVNKNSLPLIGTVSSGDGAPKPSIYKYVSLKLGYKVKRINVGAKASLVTAGYKNFTMTRTWIAHDGMFHNKMVHNSIFTGVFADYYWGGFFAGINGGIIIPQDNVYTVTSKAAETQKETKSETKLSYLFGLDVGYSYPISKRINIFLEINPSFALIKQKGERLSFKESGKGKDANYTQHYGTIKAFYIPLSLGITYSF